MDQDLQRVDFARALIWLYIRAPAAAAEAQRRLDALRDALDPDQYSRNPDTLVGLLTDTAWYLRQLAQELRSLAKADQWIPPDSVQDDPDEPVTPPKPLNKAFQAWSIRAILGITNQKEIAEEMTRRGVPATQGQVSKWLGQVEKYLAAGGILPDYGSGGKPESVDPAVLEMGARQDGLTPRQRQRRDPDADSDG